MKTVNFKKLLMVSLVAVFAVFGLVKSGLAQEQTAAGDIPQELLPLAQELGCASRDECEKAFNNNFEKGLELAEKHKVYGEEQRKIALSFKQEVIARLSAAAEENFDEMIVKIANDILKKPTVAKTLKIDKEEVRAAETIVTEIRNAGVSTDICSRPAESLTREQLISCFEASKKLAKQSKIVERYMPRGVIEKTEMLDSAVKLEEALARGEYQGLGKTAEEVGQKCLRPGSESLTACDEIAVKYFGPEGVKELAAVRAQTKQAGDIYLKGLEKMELVTPDGRKITGKDSIRKTCDAAFETRNTGLAKACGDFAVKNGFVSREEIEESLKIFESFAAGPQVDFEKCRVNPEACREFIPEEFKGDFDSGIKVYELMKAEMGFDPIQCERAAFDFALGQKCFEGSKKALPKLKELAGSSAEARRMVSEIEFRVKQGEEMEQRKNEVEKTFASQAGPGGCKSPEECFAYCSNPANGAECIAFGAKHEVFDQKEVVGRFQQYNQAFTRPVPVGIPGGYEGGSGGGGGQYPYNYQDGFRGTSQPYQPQQGGYYPPPGQGYGVSYPGPGPVGPSPECFAAIQTGDFAKAKEICVTPQYVTPPPPSYPYRTDSSASVNFPPRSICPAMPEIDCQPGTQKIYKPTTDGCGRSECVLVANEQKCSSEQYWKVTGEGGQGFCAPKESYSSYSYNPKEKCYKEGGTWTGEYCKYPDYNQRSSYSYSSSNYQNTASCPENLVNLLGSGCHFMYNDDSGARIYCNGEMTKSAKYGDAATTDGCASTGNYSSYSYSAPSGQREQIWNTNGLRSWVRTDADSARIARLKEACANVPGSAWDIWMPGAGNYQSPDFGMPDEAKCLALSPGSQAAYSYSSYNSGGYSPYAGDANSCPGFSYSRWDSSGRRYCQLNNERKCDYNYPSYLTNGANYTAENCPASDSGSSYGGYSSYGNYSSYSYSSYGYNYPQCDWSTQYLKGSTNTCMPRSDCYNTAHADYNSSECQGVRNIVSGGYASSYGGYSYSSASACPSNLLGSGCHDMGSAYFNSAMDQYVNYGGSTVKNCATEYINGCASWSNSSYSTGGSYSSYSTGGSSYSSYDSGSYSSYSGGGGNGGSYSSAYDASAACAQSGGSWNGSSCVMPNTVSSAADYSSATTDPSAACAQAGGTWDGTTCVMSNTTLNGNSGSFMASLSEILKDIFGIFSR
ncbi:MAG: hypothetical protein HUT38_02560 [Candidatus Paceibacter sp.]|nr:hypothetical protein [Candidatus Paceibacter sp.]